MKGDKGDPGTSTAAYLQATSSQAFFTPPGLPFFFPDLGPASGITYNGSQFTVTSAGTYQVTFFLAANTLNGHVYIRVNGTVPTIKFSTTSTTDISGTQLLTLAAGDTLRLNSDSPTEPSNNAPGSVTASITIQRIGDPPPIN